MSDIKTCKSCGESKPLTEFYLHLAKASGSEQRNSRCKECVKIRSAKNVAKRAGRQYHTLQEWREKIGNSPKKLLREQAIQERERQKQERKRWMESSEGRWTVAMKRALARMRSNARQRSAMLNPWVRKFEAVVRGMWIRKKLQPMGARTYRRSSPLNWEDALIRGWSLAKAAWKRQINIASNPWWVTMETKARNWSRKSNAKKSRPPLCSDC
jgi:hypothetical protein